MMTRKTKQDFNKKLIKTMITYLLIFGIPAVLGAFLGNFIDEFFNIKPVGSILILFVAYVVSWAVAYRTYSYINSKNKIDIKKDKTDE